MRRRLRVAGPNVAAARGAGSVVAGRGRSATMSPMDKKLAKDFRSFADLAAAYERDRDYRIVQRHCPGSSVAIVAPHGGSIEAHTSDIARDIAGQEFNLYLFEGLLKAGNFAALHLSSARFDEPACLALLADCDQVVTVHGCGNAGEVVLMGGRDAGLREAIASRLRALGLSCEDAPAGLDAIDPATCAIGGEAVPACNWSCRWNCAARRGGRC